MPDILAMGLGGGSLVSDEGKTIGPQSVGHNLVTEGLAFGGSTLTATDILVAAGLTNVGPNQHPVNLPAETIANGLRTIQETLNLGIEKMMPSSDPLPVVLVGGGAILVSEKLTAASEMLCPEHSGVANAIGAAIAQIGRFEKMRLRERCSLRQILARGRSGPKNAGLPQRDRLRQVPRGLGCAAYPSRLNPIWTRYRKSALQFVRRLWCLQISILRTMLQVRLQ